jgi:hypothetical protein
MELLRLRAGSLILMILEMEGRGHWQGLDEVERETLEYWGMSSLCFRDLVYIVFDVSGGISST